MFEVGDFAGMESAIDVDEGLEFVGEGVGLFVVDAAGHGEAVGDLFVVIELLEVFGVGDEGDVPIAALRALADVD